MSSIDHHYLLQRERTCRRQADLSANPAVRAVHLQLADHYARRAGMAAHQPSDATQDAGQCASSITRIAADYAWSSLGDGA